MFVQKELKIIQDTDNTRTIEGYGFKVLVYYTDNISVAIKQIDKFEVPEIKITSSYPAKDISCSISMDILKGNEEEITTIAENIAAFSKEYYDRFDELIIR